MDRDSKNQWENAWVIRATGEAWKMSSARLQDSEAEINRAAMRLSETEDKIEDLLKSILEGEMPLVTDELQARLDLEVKNLRKRNSKTVADKRAAR